MGSSLKTIAGGALGFAVGGPMGAAVGAGIGSGMDAAKATKKAASTQERAAASAESEQRRQFDISSKEQRRQFELAQQQLEPFRKAGVTALGEQQALLGLGGTPEEQQQAFAAFADSPGQQFLRDQQERALLRNVSAIGGLGGGNVRTALQKQAFGRAQTDYQTQLNRLAALSGTGQTAATQAGQFGIHGEAGIGQLGARTAANIGTLQQAGGAARASGILGQQQAVQQTVGGLTGLAAQGGLFNQQSLGSGPSTSVYGQAPRVAGSPLSTTRPFVSGVGTF